jgi:hypothetical protein
MYSLAGRSILNFRNNYLQETLLLTYAIILIIFFSVLNTLVLFAEFPHKINSYDSTNR